MLTLVQNIWSIKYLVSISGDVHRTLLSSKLIILNTIFVFPSKFEAQETYFRQYLTSSFDWFPQGWVMAPAARTTNRARRRGRASVGATIPTGI